MREPMLYQSTRGDAAKISAADAICRGIAPDGGLYVPVRFPRFDKQALADLLQKDYLSMAVALLQEFLTDFTAQEIEGCVRAAYAPQKFENAEPAAVKLLSPATAMLELWHGPTCAFKDMALQLLPQLLSKALHKCRPGKTAVILVATSGDTGKAALEGFKNAENIQIAVFYPENGVSDMQKRQMATQEGDNVFVCAIKGNFDDAQTGVKKIFADTDFAAQLAKKGCFLSSANSINWGRLLPQIVYYFYTYACMVRNGALQQGQEMNVCVPTGNFGNILAAYYAKKMGLPIATLICASNRNNILTQFIQTGCYDRNRDFYLTQSPSMDILISSNLERLLYDVSDGDCALVADMQAQLAQNGRYTVSGAMLQKIRGCFAAGFCDDVMGAAAIRNTFIKYQYLLDTHTAVAMQVYLSYKEQTQDSTPTVVVSTASPYKFAFSVLQALHVPTDEDPFVCAKRLQEATQLAIPAPIAQLMDKPVRFTQTCPTREMESVLLNYLDLSLC